ncbi:ABC transporter [Aureococcus anophagefferens]|uniref:ABC transporter n=1 Tax=Aureococcus anophagefferens TaxID=44056 RepID=A0ABR1G298_AURAN
MAASYRVTALDLLRTQASSEEDNRKAVARYYGGALLLAHVVDVCSAVGLLVAYTDGHWRALVAPLLRLDFAFRKELTDMLALALLRRGFVPSADRARGPLRARAPYANAACCGCGRKKEGSTRASDASGGAYVALGGPTTPAARRSATTATTPRDLSALADEENSANKALAQFRTHCFLGLIFVCSTFTQVYVGMKVNTFEWGPGDDATGLERHSEARAEARRKTRVAQILLTCSSVLFTNVMVYIARELVKELTRDEGLFLPKVHAHPLVFDARTSAATGRPGPAEGVPRAVATYLYLMIAQGVCSAMYRAAFAVVSRTILYTNLSRKVLSAWAEANAVATEALRARPRAVKAFVRGAVEAARNARADACGEALRLGIRDAMGFGVTSALTGYLDLGTGVLILWYGGLIVLNKSEGLTIGELVTFQLYWTMMNSSYQNLQGLVTSFTRSAAAAEKVFSLIDSLPDINEDDGAAIDWGVQGSLVLESVEFHYVMRPDAKVLSGVDLGIDAKSVCALVGRSGGGKSTIISLLMRFSAFAGSLKLDGRDVRGLNVRDYRQLFGIVAQDTPLFAREPRIILLDEATSALDEDSQAAVQKSLDALIKRGGSTVVLVAHRLSAKGIYASLVKKQISKSAAVLDQGKAEDSKEKAAEADTVAARSSLAPLRRHHRRQRGSASDAAASRTAAARLFCESQESGCKVPATPKSQDPAKSIRSV